MTIERIDFNNYAMRHHSNAMHYGLVVYEMRTNRNSIKIDIQTTDIEHRLQLTVRWNPTDMQKPVQMHPVTDMELALLLVARIPPIHVKNITSTFSSAPRFCSGSSISIHSRSLIVQRSVRHLRSRKRSATKKRNTKKNERENSLLFYFHVFTTHFTTCIETSTLKWQLQHAFQHLQSLLKIFGASSARRERTQFNFHSYLNTAEAALELVL